MKRSIVRWPDHDTVRKPGPTFRHHALAAGLVGCLVGHSFESRANDRASKADLNSLEATRSRPLFSPTRRPPPAPPSDAALAAMTAAPPTPPPRLQLSGVIVGDGKRIAIVTRLENAKTLDVEVGNQIDGWTVARISSRGITLKRDNRVLDVELPEPGR